MAAPGVPYLFPVVVAMVLAVRVLVPLLRDYLAMRFVERMNCRYGRDDMRAAAEAFRAIRTDCRHLSAVKEVTVDHAGDLPGPPSDTSQVTDRRRGSV